VLILAIFLSFVILGAHLRLPIEIATARHRSAEAQASAPGDPIDLPRLWGLIASPLLLTVGILWIFIQLRTPDFGIGGGFERQGTGLFVLPPEIKLIAILFLTLAITDLMVLFGGRSFDSNVWRIVALLGVVATVGCAYGFNATALRIESANVVQSQTVDGFYVESGAAAFLPGGPLRSFTQAILLTMIGFASGGLLAAPMRAQTDSQKGGSEPSAASSLLRFVSVPAAISAVLYLVTVPGLVRSALVQQQDHLTALAAAALLLICPWLPRPFRWPSLAAAAVLFSLFLSRIIVLT
jgi:hypothetical protein